MARQDAARLVCPIGASTGASKLPAAIAAGIVGELLIRNAAAGSGARAAHDLGWRAMTEIYGDPSEELQPLVPVLEALDITKTFRIGDRQ